LTAHLSDISPSPTKERLYLARSCCLSSGWQLPEQLGRVHLSLFLLALREHRRATTWFLISLRCLPRRGTFCKIARRRWRTQRSTPGISSVVSFQSALLARTQSESPTWRIKACPWCKMQMHASGRLGRVNKEPAFAIATVTTSKVGGKRADDPCACKYMAPQASGPRSAVHGGMFPGGYGPILGRREDS
jgi:hypothetical protein